MLRRIAALCLAVALGGCGDEEPAPAPEPATDSCRDQADEAPPKAEPLASRLTPTIAKAAEGCYRGGRAHDTETDTTVSGTWEGSFGYDDGRPGVDLELTLNVREGRLRGTMTEPNTFGPAGYARLEADVVGEAVRSHLVTFMKTYRTGSLDHSILYVGELSEDGKKIEGTWTLGESQGPFSLAKTGPE